MVGALGLVALLAAGACGGDDDSSDDADTGAADDGGAAGGDATLEVSEFEFSDVEATAGGSLEVTNSSGAPHTITADDGAFDEELPDGETVPVTVPAEPGSYAFHCEIHPDMQATLIVG